MEGSTLKLTVEKGPREGETLVCKAGSVVRIGRLVKGNTFPIKDGGISSKHLLIEWKASKWVVVDLESSNGTLLNNVKLQALQTYDLRDGDMIKIGECTSIKVNVEETRVDERSKRAGRRYSVEDVDGLGAENGVNQVRRNPSRRAVSKKVSKEELIKYESYDSEVQILPEKSNIAQEEDCGEAKMLPPLPKGRGRGRGRSRGRGRGRGGGAAATKVGDLKDGELLESYEVQGISGSSNIGPESSREQENVLTVGENWIGRAASKNQPSGSVSEVHKITESSNLGRDSCKEADDIAPVVQEKPRPVVARRRTRSSKDDDESSVSVSGLPKIPESSCLGQESCREPGNKVLVEEKRGGRVALEGNKVSEDETLAPVSVPASDAQLGGSNSEKETYEEQSRGPENVVAVAENQTGAQKRMRPSKNEPAGAVHKVHNVTETPAFVQESCSKPENAAPAEQKLRRGATLRRTRSSKDNDEPSVPISVSVAPDIPESSNLGQENCGELRNEAHVEDQSGKVAIEGIKASEDEIQLSGSKSQMDTSKEPLSTSAAKEHPVKADYGKELEKMTLGEWFDYLEVYLPQQIYDTTEEIILGMREKAKQFNELMSQQQNGKAKHPAV